MKNIILVVVSFFGLCVLVFLMYLIHLGVMAKVQVVESNVGPYTMVYKEEKAVYSMVRELQLRMAEAIKNEDQVEVRKRFGMFTQDPAKSIKAPMECKIGCILEEADKETIAKLEKKYKIMQFPETNSLTVVFPYQDMTSFVVGAVKVYPEFEKYAQQKGYKISAPLEILDTRLRKIFYSMRIEKK